MDEKEYLTDIGRKVTDYDMVAQYDAQAKSLLSEKSILAPILIYTVDYFKGMKSDDVIPLIDKQLKISEIPLLPNSVDDVFRDVNENSVEDTMPCVTGDNAEDTVVNEGRVTYDIRFSVFTPDRKHRIKLLMDIEAQKEYYTGYDMATRATFNVARMISAQYGTEFADSDYQKLKRVYSIFICMNVPGYAENTLTTYKMSEQNVIGEFPKDKVYYDIPHIAIIGLSDRLPENKDEYRLHRLLGAIFCMNVPVAERKRILEEEFGIPMTKKIDGMVNDMCNLGEGIYENGIRQGMKQGMELNKVASVKNIMETLHLTLDQALKALKIPAWEYEKYTSNTP